MLCILTSQPMPAHAFAWSKTIKKALENDQKHAFFIMHTKGTCKAYFNTKIQFNSKSIFNVLCSLFTPVPDLHHSQGGMKYATQKFHLYFICKMLI